MCTVKALQIPAHGQQGTPGSHLGHPVLLAVGVLVCQQTSQGVLCLRWTDWLLSLMGLWEKIVSALGLHALPAFDRIMRERRLPWVISGVPFLSIAYPLSHLSTQRGAQTQEPEIKCPRLYWLSWPGAHKLYIFKESLWKTSCIFSFQVSSSELAHEGETHAWWHTLRSEWHHLLGTGSFWLARWASLFSTASREGRRTARWFSPRKTPSGTAAALPMSGTVTTVWPTWCAAVEPSCL